ncbi:endolytic transglycosylase MltG [Tepidimonas charontis]|uniref:Endolytic murein transglycosylase n=1 Tax=Tepidimonas charontis TaxID=2267262 RepID=A0A554XI81_9BURK|nr:endolytic transglycosylase MltG [Tepidimonas charontis]TSE35545.1 Endolytic murein transglycosylase [Tepidimonas charontis]
MVVAVWLNRPLPLRGGNEAVLDVWIQPGQTVGQVAQTVVQAGVETPALWLHAWFRLSGQGRRIQAGSYELRAGVTPRSLLEMLVRGQQATRRLTLIEGWNVREVLQAVRSAEFLIDDLPPGHDPVALARHLGLSAEHAEGRLFPDTYVYPKRSLASRVLRQAAAAMEARLAQAWAQRQPDLPLRSPDEALILASLVEKETGRDADRARIAAVFINRLRIGMRLQTDPSVIYGMGEAFDGNLRRRDLLTDTPYNTYTRAGLPPTPIAIPSWASLLAAVQPAPTRDLYFVARGDGTSAFSRTLEEHNRAVRRYQLGLP